MTECVLWTFQMYKFSCFLLVMWMRKQLMFHLIILQTLWDCYFWINQQKLVSRTQKKNAGLFQPNFGSNIEGSRGLTGESRTYNWKVASLSLGPAGIVRGGSEWTVLSLPSIPRRGALEQVTEPPTAPRVPQHKWLPTALCVFTAVCVHLDG